MFLKPDDVRAFFTLWSCIDAFVCRQRSADPEGARRLRRDERMLARVRPVGYAAMVDTVLLPFRGVIVWDGFPTILNISFGSGHRQTYRDAYLTAKDRGELVASLGSSPRAAVPRIKGTDWRPALSDVVRATEALGKPDTALQSASFRLLKQCVLTVASIRVSLVKGARHPRQWGDGWLANGETRGPHQVGAVRAWH